MPLGPNLLQHRVRLSHNLISVWRRHHGIPLPSKSYEYLWRISRGHLRVIPTSGSTPIDAGHHCFRVTAHPAVEGLRSTLRYPRVISSVIIIVRVALMLQRSNRWIRVILKMLALVVVVLVFAGMVYEQIGRRRDRKRFSKIGRSVDIGGRTLNLYCTGEGVLSSFSK